jgi:hypothetical protein
VRQGVGSFVSQMSEHDDSDDGKEELKPVKRRRPTVDEAKRVPMPPKAARKAAKAERKRAKSADGRSRGRDNDYVINSIPAERRTAIWATVKAQKKEIDRSDEKIPMENCWTFGARKGYSYYQLAHGESQLKLTQLAIWVKDSKVSMYPFLSCYAILCFRYQTRALSLLIVAISSRALTLPIFTSLT